MDSFRPGRRDLLLVAGLFVASTVFYALLGVRFDASTLSDYMQFIDQHLLADRLLESLWFYHASPPLLNLLAGIGEKLLGEQSSWLFSICFHILGFLAAYCVYALTLYLSHSRVAAGVATGLLAFSPSFVLYQNWLMYEFPSMALLTIAAWALHRYVETKSTKWCVTFFATLATLLLVRSLFHLVWMVLVVLLLIAILGDRRRQVLVAAAVPVLVIAFWYGKNYYYFNSFAASSWMGLGLSNISTMMIPPERLAPLVEEGRLSPWSMISRYENADVMFRSEQLPPTGVPVLDNITKSNGRYNYNFRDIVPVSRYYTADALTVIREFPASYVLGLVMANRLYFSPTSMNAYFSPANREAVRPVERVSNVLVGARPNHGRMPTTHFGFTGRHGVDVNTSLLLIGAWWLTLAFGYAQARKGILSDDPTARGRAVVIGFIVLTAIYLYVLSVGIELNENYRYRFNIEPLVLVLAATGVTALVRAARRRFSAAAASPAT